MPSRMVGEWKEYGWYLNPKRTEILLDLHTIFDWWAQYIWNDWWPEKVWKKHVSLSNQHCAFCHPLIRIHMMNVPQSGRRWAIGVILLISSPIYVVPLSKLCKLIEAWWCIYALFNTSMPWQNDRHLADNIFKCISWIKMYQLWLKLHWNLFLRVHLTIFQHWFQ